MNRCLHSEFIPCPRGNDNGQGTRILDFQNVSLPGLRSPLSDDETAQKFVHVSSDQQAVEREIDKRSDSGDFPTDFHSCPLARDLNDDSYVS